MATKRTIRDDSPIEPEPAPSGEDVSLASAPSGAAVPEPVPDPVPEPEAEAPIALSSPPEPIGGHPPINPPANLESVPGLIPGQPTPPAYTPTRVVICWGAGESGSRAYGWVTEAQTIEATSSGPVLEVRATDIGEATSYRLTLYPPGVEVPEAIVARGRPYALAAHDPRLL